MTEIPEEIRKEAKKELARRYFWDFEKALYPRVFTDDRKLLKIVADTMQDFYLNSSKHYLVISLPPGHYKSFTGKNFVEWALGLDPMKRIISASNAHDLAETFSTQIRDTILGINVGKDGITYPEIFPDTKIKQGFATKSKWELDGAPEPTYRATSPSSTITGARSDLFVFDDIVKNALDALNMRNLEAYWTWFKDTIFSRADGNDYKFIFIMQRWAKADLSGHIIDFYGDDVEVVDFPIEKDGVILEPTIMSREKLEAIRKTTSPEIFSANYMQEPIDIKGRLYESLQEWTELPKYTVKKAYVDTADTGKDYFCGMPYVEADGKVYITDAIFTQKPAEFTETETAKMLTRNDVNEALFESNNGGRGFARNIERIMRERGNNKTVVKWQATTANKEARILASSAWVQQNVFMPKGWAERWPEMAAQILSYVAGAKNEHDDALDVLAAIYEQITAKPKFEFSFN